MVASNGGNTTFRWNVTGFNEWNNLNRVKDTNITTYPFFNKRIINIQGQTNQTVYFHLNASPNTVRKFIRNLYKFKKPWIYSWLSSH